MRYGVDGKLVNNTKVFVLHGAYSPVDIYTPSPGSVLLISCIDICMGKSNANFAWQYDKDARLIMVDVVKPKADRTTDLSRAAYYMEKDVSTELLL